MIDLHLHTSMSDGSDSPSELLKKISQTDCKVFSVTDHDDLRANAVVLELLKQNPIKAKFVTGTEIASVFLGRNLHLLCYGFNPSADSMTKLVAKGSRLRKERMLALFEHLKTKHKIEIPAEDQAEILSRKIPGKTHICDAAMKLGLNISRKEFFENFLEDMESRHFKVSGEEVIEAATKAGGVVSFAHPVEVEREYKIDSQEIAKMTKALKNCGLSAIEAYNCLHFEKQVLAYEKIARELNLLVSGGSDYHGKNKPVAIGQLTAYGFVPSGEKITVLGVIV